MTPRHRGRRLAAVVLGATLALAGCTGVPTSSSPSTVAPIDIAGRTESVQAGPADGLDPRSIVVGFQAANSADPTGHDTARKYLAPASRADWSDATATIVTGLVTSNIDRGYITVSGRVLGSLTQNGVYVPQLLGTGDGGPVEQFKYRMGQVGGQWRIIDPPPGLLLTYDQFNTAYRQHSLYFFDQAHRYLVPDLRWTALQGASLYTWLVGQLATGPRPDLASSVATDTLPTQATSRRIVASGETPIEVEVPGSSQLDRKAKLRLAAQISATVTEPTSSDPVELTDGGNRVPMPGTSDPQFSANQLYDLYSPRPPEPDVFYLRNGDVLPSTGKTLKGKLTDSPFYLSSIGVTQTGSGSQLTVAGVTATGVLVLGTQTGGYRATSVRGQLSRPAWAPEPPAGSPALSEVWIGVGGQLVRVAVDGNRGTPSIVSVNAGAGGGRIVALRLSPEGSRIAMVIASPNGSQRLYIGSVVRSAGQVRVDSLPVISPEEVSIDDVAWIGPTKVIAIGGVGGTGANRAAEDPRIFESNVDGSFWTGRAIGSTLPGRPDSITVSIGQLAWVSSNQTVWEQLGKGWQAPRTGDQTPGEEPVYLE